MTPPRTGRRAPLLDCVKRNYGLTREDLSPPGIEFPSASGSGHGLELHSRDPVSALVTDINMSGLA
jgi:hypothetical protein